jgi:hypothetical protein
MDDISSYEVAKILVGKLLAILNAGYIEWLALSCFWPSRGEATEIG